MADAYCARIHARCREADGHVLVAELDGAVVGFVAVLTRDDSPLQFWAILSEGALRQLVGGATVMRAQLAHLIQIGSDQPNVNLQVLPFAAGAHAATSGPFAIMKFPDAPDLGVVYLEGQTGGIYLDTADEVARYTLVFEHLRASALSTAATARLIQEVARKT